MSLRHAFVSAAADSADATKLRPSDWGSTSTDYDTAPTHVFSGGALGSLLYRDTGAVDGSNWLADVAVGSVLVSGGVGAAPAWSATPTISSLTIAAGQVAGATTGIYEGATGLIRTFRPTGGNGYNLFIGNSGNSTMSPSGGAATLASANFAMGDSSLVAVTTGFNNIAIGVGAMGSTTTGYGNVAIGGSTLAANVDGYLNVAIGKSALATNTSGHSNVAVGDGTLNLNTTGYYNAALGVSALARNTEGYYNVGLGDQALAFNTTGYYNTAVGVSALFGTTTGQYNSAVGVLASQGNTTGYDNVAFGHRALYTATIAIGNTAIGANALESTTEGGSNTAVGRKAGETATPANANVSGVQNVWVGEESGPGTSSQLTNAIAIGYRALNTASNEVVLGNSSITATTLRGTVTAPILASAQLNWTGGQTILGSTADLTELYRAANPQFLAVYNTRTSASVYERVELGFAGNTAYLRTQALGGGTQRTLRIDGAEIQLMSAGSARARVDANGVYPGGGSSNTYDLGLVGTTWRTGYFGTSVSSPAFIPTTRQTYTASNVVTDRSYDANATTIDEVADVLGTLIADLRAIGLVL